MPTKRKERQDESRPDLNRCREAKQKAARNRSLIAQQKGSAYHLDEEELHVSYL